MKKDKKLILTMKVTTFNTYQAIKNESLMYFSVCFFQIQEEFEKFLHHPSNMVV